MKGRNLGIACNAYIGRSSINLCGRLVHIAYVNKLVQQWSYRLYSEVQKFSPSGL